MTDRQPPVCDCCGLKANFQICMVSDGVTSMPKYCDEHFDESFPTVTRCDKVVPSAIEMTPQFLWFGLQTRRYAIWSKAVFEGSDVWFSFPLSQLDGITLVKRLADGQVDSACSAIDLIINALGAKPIAIHLDATDQEFRAELEVRQPYHKDLRIEIDAIFAMFYGFLTATQIYVMPTAIVKGQIKAAM